MESRVFRGAICLFVLECVAALIVPTPQNLPFRSSGKETSKVKNSAKFVGLELGLYESVEPGWNDGLFGGPQESGVKGNFIPFTGECTKFCANSGGKGGIRDIALMWSNEDVDLRGDASSMNHRGFVRLRNTNDPFQNCQIHLDVDCDLAENLHDDKAGQYFNQRINHREDNCKLAHNEATVQTLAEEYSARGSSVQKFYVNDVFDSVMVKIMGDLSRATLQMPKSAPTWRTGVEISLRRVAANGVEIHVRGAPPGEWSLKLAGVENSKYCFLVESELGQEKPPRDDVLIDFLGRSKPRSDGDATKIHYDDRSTSDDNINPEVPDDLEMIPAMSMNFDSIWDTSGIKSRSNRKVYFERSVEDPFKESERDPDVLQPPTDIATARAEPIIAFSNNKSYLELNDRTNYKDDATNFTFITKGFLDIQGRSSIASLEDFEIIRNGTTSNDDISSRMVELGANQELSNELSRFTDDEESSKRKMLIEVNRNSNLLVNPGTVHRIVFDVMNGCVLPVRYAFQAKSSAFRVYNLQPLYAWIYPGQTSQVAVDLVIPNTVGPDSASTLSLSIVGTEIKEKSVYLYVQGSSSRVRDDVPPTMEYSFNNNCGGKLDRNLCNKSRWSVDFTIQDYNSGLKRVIASPNNVYPRADFVSGTKEPVTFFYTSSCCDTSMRITAIDLYNNLNTRTIDVTIWNNLSESEIAAITVGALLILLLIILIVLIILYCLRTKKSHDLPYTQRYGSRAAPQPERTSF